MVTFNAPFILRLGGSNALLGLMPSLAALMAIIFTLPAARFLERRANRKPWVIGSLALGRTAYLFIALVPWLVPASAQAMAVVVITVLQAVPIALFNAGFLGLLGDVCPPDRRSRFFSTRLFLLALSVAISTLLSGLWLNAIPFPINYQVLNALAFVTAEYSTFLVAKTQFPTYPVPAQATTRRARLISLNFDWRAAWRQYAANRGFANLNFGVLIGWIGIWGAAPLLTLYFVKDLNFDEAWLGVNGTLAQVGTMIGAVFWPRIIDRRGDRWLFLRSLALYWMYPLLIVLIPLSLPILGFGFAAATLDPAINVTLFNVLLALMPEGRRSSYMAAHIALMNIGAMIAPLLMVGLADAIGVPVALVLCSLIRLIGLLWLWVLPMDRSVAQTPAPGAGTSLQ
jgi:MFS family permease